MFQPFSVCQINSDLMQESFIRHGLKRKKRIEVGLFKIGNFVNKLRKLKAIQNFRKLVLKVFLTSLTVFMSQSSFIKDFI